MGRLICIKQLLQCVTRNVGFMQSLACHCKSDLGGWVGNKLEMTKQYSLSICFVTNVASNIIVTLNGQVIYCTYRLPSESPRTS